jgi:thioredoxin-like negative regulator of GroEL
MEIVIKDFYSDNCGACKSLVPVLDQIHEEFTNVKIEKINVMEDPQQAADFNVMGVPSVFILVDGKEVHFGKGFHPYELLKGKLDEILEG